MKKILFSMILAVAAMNINAQLVVDSLGRVGIGTNTPSYALSVSGSGRNETNAQDLTLSDVQNSGCMQSTRAKANRDEVMPSIILTKEGSILTVQLFNYEANCGTTGFNVIPSMSGGSDGSPLSVSILIGPIVPDYEDCECPYNISFTLHGLEANSFYFSCAGYEGQVRLKDGEPYELWKVTDVIIDGVTYRLNKEKKTATLITGRTVEGELNIPAEVSYGGQTCSVTSIEYFAFIYNTKLTSVTIPGSVTSIDLQAFYDCENLKDVYCYASNVPTTGKDVFKGIPASATLHVLAGSVEKYKTTEPWSGFGNIVALTTTPVNSILNDEPSVNSQSHYDLQGRKLSGKPARGIYIEDGKKKVK